jgi:hypothetical protein
LGALAVGAAAAGPPTGRSAAGCFLVVWAPRGFQNTSTTEPDAAWYDDGATWATSLPYLSTTLHLAPVDTLLHRILQHPPTWT